MTPGSLTVQLLFIEKTLTEPLLTRATNRSFSPFRICEFNHRRRRDEGVVEL